MTWNKKPLIPLMMVAGIYLLFFGLPYQVQSTPQAPPPSLAQPREGGVTLFLDKTVIQKEEPIQITVKAPPGKPVFLEIASEKLVRTSRFDSKKDEKTGKIPYILYMSYEIPAFYQTLVPANLKEKVEEIKKDKNWSYAQALKDLGAEAAFLMPAKARVERYQASLLNSIIGSRGTLLSPMEDKENKKRTMQLIKARFRSVGKVLSARVEVKEDGAFSAGFVIPAGSADGKYQVTAVVDKETKSAPVIFERKISFFTLYFASAGTTINLFGPFFLALAVTIFGVLMGAGGGFILNPLLISIYPLPHAIVAGTVMPTVLFSQLSGIINYSKIKFISWKLGIIMGLSMLVGGFIGPKLTELITLDQYKFVFGWILLILAALMVWQTLPNVVGKNKKEQAILNEYKKRAQEKKG